MVTERAPYTVACSAGGETPAVLRSWREARSYAQGVANRLDIECAITDRFGTSTLVRRASFAPNREWDPFRDRPFFHPNPEHPRSRKRFLRNEPQGWTPGMGPSTTRIKPREFFGMNDNSGLLAAFAPPVLLLGIVLFLTRKQGELGADALVRKMQQQLPGIPRAPGGPPRPTRPEVRNGGRKMMPAIKGRYAARKLYGNAVLASQASGSLRKLALNKEDPSLSNLAAKLQQISNELMSKAHANDAGFVRAKMAPRG